MLRKPLLHLTIFITAAFASVTAHAAGTRLTPLPCGKDTQPVCLNGKWMFNPTPENNFQRSTLTRGWKAVMLPESAPSREVPSSGGYRRNFFVPERWRGERIMLRGDGIGGENSIWVNGRLAGEQHAGSESFEYDVTDMVNPGTINEIAVSAAGGITRGICLFSVPVVSLSDLCIGTVGDDRKLAVTSEITNRSKTSAPGFDVALTLTDATGETVASATICNATGNLAPASTVRATADLDVAGLSLWQPSEPTLYRLTCSLLKDGKTTETVAREIGLHSQERGGLTGVTVCLPRGSSDFSRQLATLSGSNVNFIKVIGATPDESFFHLCDSLGLYVEADAPSASRLGHSLLATSSRLLTLSLPADADSRDAWVEALDAARKSLSADHDHDGILIESGKTVLDETDLWDIRKTFSQLRVSLSENIRPDGYTQLEITNLSDHDNLEGYSFSWHAGKSDGRFDVSCEPGTTSRINFTIPSEAYRADSLTIAVADRSGNEVDRYRFAMRASSRRINSEEKAVRPLTFLEKSDAYLLTDGTTTCAISKITGLMSISNGKTNIVRGPRLTADDGNGHETLKGWIARTIVAEQSRQEVTVTVEGRCADADGTIIYSFSPDGEIDINVDFRILRDMRLRSAGLLFTADTPAERLSWLRNARWDAYPPDHPDAESGLVSSASPAFSAAKRDFRQAIITYSDGCTLEIKGTGRQNLRTVSGAAGTRIFVTSDAQSPRPLTRGTVFNDRLTLTVR